MREKVEGVREEIEGGCERVGGFCEKIGECCVILKLSVSLPSGLFKVFVIFFLECI